MNANSLRTCVKVSTHVARTAALSLARSSALAIIAMAAAQAQTYQVVYNFTGGVDGSSPWAGLTMDAAGNLYGTTASAGTGEGGTVFKLSRRNGILTTLYSFQGGSDGSSPQAPLTIGPDGNLYGNTRYGGEGSSGCMSCGTVFSVEPSATAWCKNAPCSWNDTVLHRFAGSGDGMFPGGTVAFDQAGHLYGTTSLGGTHGNDGTLYELTLSQGIWTQEIIYQFGQGDGSQPFAGVVIDEAGTIYCTTTVGGSKNRGTVSEFIPHQGGWEEKVLYSFQAEDDGWYPTGGLIFDPAGNLYGTTTWGGANSGGTVFELIRGANGNWTFSLLYGLPQSAGYGPWASLAMDPAGNLYGTSGQGGAFGYGNIFKLTPSTDGWTYTSLYDFTGGNDGSGPFGGVTLGANGNLYGTTFYGGAHGGGVIWEFVP